MTIEEKYNKALEWMRGVYPTLTGAAQEDAKHFFPELAESEDERIRKSIIRLLQVGGYMPLEDKEKAFAYLEKQKELPFVKDVVLGYPGLYFYDGERMHFRGPVMEEKQEEYTIQEEYREGFNDGIEAVKKYPEKYGLQKVQRPTFLRPHDGDDNNPYDMGIFEAQTYAINRGFDIPFNDGEIFIDDRYMTQTIGNILRWADEHPKEQKPVEIHIDDLNIQKVDSDIKITTSDSSANGDELLYVGNKFYEIGYREGKREAEQKFTEAQDYSGLNDLERAIHRGFLSAGVENVPVAIIKETAQECLEQMKSAEWSEEDEKKITFLERLIRYNVPEGQYGWIDGHRGGFVTKLEAISMLKSLRSQPH